MSIERTLKISAWISVFLCLFASIYLSHETTLWGDEESHLASASSLNKGLGYKYYPSEKMESIEPFGNEYVRGKFTTHSTAWVLKLDGYKLFHARLLNIIFYLFLMLALWFGHHRLKLYSTTEFYFALLLLNVNAFTVEANTYVRFYVIYNLFIYCSVLSLWCILKNGLKPVNAICFLFFTIVPTIDDWQFTHLPLFILFLALYFFKEYIDSFVRKNYNKYPGLRKILPLSILTFPFLTKFCDKMFSVLKLSMGSRLYLGYFVNYVDNILAFGRFLLTLGPLVFPLKKHYDSIKQKDFQDLLFFSSTFLVLLVVLFTPHNHIFFSRFQFMPATLICLSAPRFLLRVLKPKALVYLIGIFIATNLTHMWITFYQDRANVREVISEFKDIDKTHEIITDFDYSWSAPDMRRALYIPPYFTISNKEQVLNFLNSKLKSDKVYFMYYDHYMLRDKIHFAIFGAPRSANITFSRLLRFSTIGKDIVQGRGCGIREFNKDQVLKLINEFNPPENHSIYNEFLTELKSKHKKLFKLFPVI